MASPVKGGSVKALPDADKALARLSVIQQSEKTLLDLLSICSFANDEGDSPDARLFNAGLTEGGADAETLASALVGGGAGPGSLRKLPEPGIHVAIGMTPVSFPFAAAASPAKGGKTASGLPDVGGAPASGLADDAVTAPRKFVAPARTATVLTRSEVETRIQLLREHHAALLAEKDAVMGRLMLCPAPVTRAWLADHVQYIEDAQLDVQLQLKEVCDALELAGFAVPPPASAHLALPEPELLNKVDPSTPAVKLAAYPPSDPVATLRAPDGGPARPLVIKASDKGAAATPKRATVEKEAEGTPRSSPRAPSPFSRSDDEGTSAATVTTIRIAGPRHALASDPSMALFRESALGAGGSADVPFGFAPAPSAASPAAGGSASPAKPGYSVKLKGGATWTPAGAKGEGAAGEASSSATRTWLVDGPTAAIVSGAARNAATALTASALRGSSDITARSVRAAGLPPPAAYTGPHTATGPGGELYASLNPALDASYGAVSFALPVKEMVEEAVSSPPPPPALAALTELTELGLPPLPHTYLGRLRAESLEAAEQEAAALAAAAAAAASPSVPAGSPSKDGGVKPHVIVLSGGPGGAKGGAAGAAGEGGGAHAADPFAAWMSRRAPIVLDASAGAKSSGVGGAAAADAAKASLFSRVEKANSQAASITALTSVHFPSFDAFDAEERARSMRAAAARPITGEAVAASGAAVAGSGSSSPAAAAGISSAAGGNGSRSRLAMYYSAIAGKEASAAAALEEPAAVSPGRSRLALAASVGVLPPASSPLSPIEASRGGRAPMLTASSRSVEAPAPAPAAPTARPTLADGESIVIEKGGIKATISTPRPPTKEKVVTASDWLPPPAPPPPASTRKVAASGVGVVPGTPTAAPPSPSSTRLGATSADESGAAVVYVGRTADKWGDFLQRRGGATAGGPSAAAAASPRLSDGASSLRSPGGRPALPPPPPPPSTAGAAAFSPAAPTLREQLAVGTPNQRLDALASRLRF